MKVREDKVLCPRWAVPHLEWELDPNVGAANPLSLGFYSVALFPLVTAVEVQQAGQLVAFFPSLPPFFSTPYMQQVLLALLLGGPVPLLMPGKDAAKEFINLTCFLLDYGHM